MLRDQFFGDMRADSLQFAQAHTAVSHALLLEVLQMPRGSRSEHFTLRVVGAVCCAKGVGALRRTGGAVCGSLSRFHVGQATNITRGRSCAESR